MTEKEALFARNNRFHLKTFEKKKLSYTYEKYKLYNYHIHMKGKINTRELHHYTIDGLTIY